MKSTQRGNRLVAVALVVFILLMVFLFVPLSTTSLSSVILPSYEGLNSYFFGASPPSSANIVYTANNPNPCPNIQGGCSFVHSIASNGPIDSTGYSWAYDSQNPGLTFLDSFGNPQTIIALHVTTYSPKINPFTGNTNYATIDYNVTDPYNSQQKVEVKGQIIVQGVDITIQVQPGSKSCTVFSGAYCTTPTFQQFQLWMMFFSNTWNNYQPLTSYTTPDTGHPLAAWSAPILLYLNSGGVAPADAQNVATTPSYTVVQQSQPLYGTPQTTSNVGLIGAPTQVQSVQNILAAGGNPYAPDTRMSEFAYFPITLNNFGAYTCNSGFSTCTGQITMHFDVYMLQLGQYLWSNPITTGQSTTTYTQPPCVTCFLGSIFTPINITLILVVIIIIVALVFAGPTLFSVRRAIG